MMSIPETIDFHRATRDKYMLCAATAKMEAGDANGLDWLAFKQWFVHERYFSYVLKRRDAKFCRAAMLCFLRHARAANRKLVQVKRLQRMLASPNNWDGWI